MTEKTEESGRGTYTYRELEARWRDHWLSYKTFKTLAPGDEGYDPAKPKCYILDMFPYASGTGLHMGHPKGYIASDIYCRYKQMQGFNVLHPMGFDSFGLPAEQFARENNVHPAQATEEIIGVVRNQLQILGMAYDWDREIATSRQDYYRWTQWIFKQLFDSWYDPNHEWQDEAGRTITGKARPISELREEFVSGARSLTDGDVLTLGSASHGPTWNELDDAQQAVVLNNYRIAYQKEVTVNWCPGLGTVLANEEVTNEGRSERGDHPVYKRPLKQWVMRITAYADRLLEDLESADMPDGRGGTYALDWPEAIKLMQRNWIGRSTGAEVLFDVIEPGTDQKVVTSLNVFTTRPDTLFGATFMVVAPEHPLLDESEPEFAVPATWPEGTKTAWKGENQSLEIRDAISAYVSAAGARTAHQRREEGNDKTGVFAGIHARNPVNGAMIPIFVADYVSMDYGTGAIMAVPGHDDRDHEFALKYKLEIKQVVRDPEGDDGGTDDAVCFTGEGIACNSPASDAGDTPYAINGRPTADAIEHMTAALEGEAIGHAAVSYKLRDWIFSRQWYWGEPFPLATHPDGYSVSTEVPVILPEMDDFQPEISDDPNHPVSPPLSRAGEQWLQVDVDGVVCRRELNVMPQWAGSCWYYLRFIDPNNSETFCAEQAERSFMPVDLYIGGAEHAVLHLLYARFWHKALFDLSHVSTPEPFKKYFNQGMITADAFADGRGTYVDIREVEIRDGEPFHSKTGEKLTRFAGKMGKRYKNGLPPEEVGAEYGIDTLRLYEMYMGPLEASAPWSMEGIRGMQRFLHRVWRNLLDRDGSPKRAQDGGGDDGAGADEGITKLLHRTIDKVTADIEALRFNTAIAALIELNNALVGTHSIADAVARDFIRLLAPFAPHVAEELWERWEFGSGDISSQSWPEVDESILVEETCVLPIQVNGKVRASVEVPVEISDADLRPLVLELENVRRHLPESGEIKRFILVPGKIVNIVA